MVLIATADLIETVVLTIGHIFYMTNLQVHKHVPIVCKVVFCLEESAVIILMCLRIIILIIIATRTIFRICLLILYISKVAEVTATELLQI